MTKDQRAEVKDVGGYVGGRINGGNRKAGTITDRQLVCLDADYGDMGLWETWDIMVGKACLMHTSHSHTPENPRLRFVIPLARAVTAAEYEPIARRVAEWLDINAFDDTTYEASRLMFWSSRPKDGEFICDIYDGEWLNPDDVLSTYDNWMDIKSWPTSDRQVNAITRMGAVQGDPLTKPGVIGAFNRAYTITEAIEQYLPGVYERTDTNRWTYTKGSTTGGAVTYDNDTFIYSHHDTDPISRRLCNAYDMVRIHLFGDRDEGSEAEIGKLPSVSAMAAMLQNDEKVRRELTNGIVEPPENVFEEKTDLQRFAGDVTEQGLAVALTDAYGSTIRYSKALGWLFWDGTRWVLDAEGEARMLVLKFTDDLYAAARIHMSLAADKEAQAKAKNEMKVATKVRSAPGINHLIALLEPMVSVYDTRIYDAFPWDLNTPDGIVDLRTGEIRAHDRRANCTKCTAISPGDQGRQKWLEFVENITGGDQAFAEYLQTLVGMAAVGEVFEEGLVISFGNGSNGKSTFFGVLKAVLGDYAKTVNADVLASSYGKSDQSYVAALRGARLVILSETEESAVMSNSQLKRLTSRDVISARSLYKDPIEFVPTHTIVMHTNHLPRLSGSVDGGTKRRIAIAPFLTTFTPDRVITNYQDVLYRDCGPAILQWIIEGAKRFYTSECKLVKPPCVVQATKGYTEEEDTIGSFAQERCEVADGKIKSSDLYLAYQVWCGTQGIHPRCTRDFAMAMEGHGYQRARANDGTWWKGLRLREEL